MRAILSIRSTGVEGTVMGRMPMLLFGTGRFESVAGEWGSFLCHPFLCPLFIYEGVARFAIEFRFPLAGPEKSGCGFSRRFSDLKPRSSMPP